MRTVTVDLGTRCYPIHIGEHAWDAPALAQLTQDRQVVLVSDTNVAPLYAQDIIARCPHALQYTLPSGETTKSFQYLENIGDFMLQHTVDRSAIVIALGGGVVGDIAGFCAAVYQRGIDYIQMPTSLLAQVDSAVGGKTAVNSAFGKNMFGVFNQPKLVTINTNTLATLPDNQWISGMAEVVKYALLGSSDFLQWLTDNCAAITAKQPDILAQMIATCCSMKADIVAKDETETGVRALLNFGHTFGHAIELWSEYKLLHGHAIGIGMVLAAKYSQMLGYIGAHDVARVIATLELFDIPTVLPIGIDAPTMLHAMYRDKKSRSGSIRLILLKQIGDAQVVTIDEPASLQQFLAQHTHASA